MSLSLFTLTLSLLLFSLLCTDMHQVLIDSNKGTSDESLNSVESLFRISSRSAATCILPLSAPSFPPRLFPSPHYPLFPPSIRDIEHLIIFSFILPLQNRRQLPNGPFNSLCDPHLGDLQRTGFYSGRVHCSSCQVTPSSIFFFFT